MLNKILILTILSFFFISCSTDEFSDQREDLHRARKQWKNAQIKNYKWTENISCECGGPYMRDILVVNSVKDSVGFDESLLFERYTSEDVYNASKTIEEAFVYIQDLINQNVASLEVEYNDIYGFPTIISVDYNVDFIDDEVLYRYIDFEIQN
ncbi:DUF6174 domain-containing protein [Aureibaculum conchae]|uniref:DUF6174 domain-containing protein n=1 Tax=Aureibaculum sp. 2308TA14-22 TaxID=3108392 RepID=UPI0033973B53